MPQDAPLCPPRIYHKSNPLFYDRVGPCTTQWCCITVDENKILSDSKMKDKMQIKPIKLAGKRLLQDWQALIWSTTVITTHTSPCKHQKPDTLGTRSVHEFVSLNFTSHPHPQSKELTSINHITYHVLPTLCQFKVMISPDQKTYRFNCTENALA